MKAVTILALVPAASAFVAPVARTASRGRSMKMNFGYTDGGLAPGAVTFFPDSAPFWDPLNLSEGDDAKVAKYQAIEIKHGRVAMLATLDYITRGLGTTLPGKLGDVDITSIPTGLAAIKAVPPAGWAQILLFASALEVLAPQKDDKVPGEVQPDTDAFKKPGDIEIRTKEINNGRLAMVSMAGIWVGELLTGGENPLHTFAPYAPALPLP